jgi:hypothetical protein
MAIPLLGETAGTIKEGMLTLYKDHENPNKVYFFPNSTKFSVDQNKVPLFSFVYWGLTPPINPQEAGAYLTMSTHLASDSSQESALKNFMDKNPDFEIAVLPIKSSVVGLTTTAGSTPDGTKSPLSALFSEFNFSKVGGRAEDEIGINAVLTFAGAKAFKALLSKSNTGQMIKFDYCYNIQGFGPNMNAIIKMNLSRVYDYFSARVSSGFWFWKSSDIKRVTEELYQKNEIAIVMNGGDATQWEALNQVAQTIAVRLFKPELSATPETTTNTFFSLNSVHKEELKEEVWNFVRRDLETREFCTSINIKDLEPYSNNLIVNADGN